MEPHAIPTLHLRVFLVLLASWTHAAAQPRPATRPPEQPPLSGPSVKDNSARTLVHTDMQGRFQKLEGRPEEAALNQLAIDPERRQKAREVIADRAAAFRRHLVDNIDLIKESTDAIKSGDAVGARRLAGELFDRFDPGHERDPLLAPLAAVLSPVDGAELKRLVDEYWNAWIAGEQRASKGSTKEAIQERLVSELFQTELRTAYEYTLRPFQQKLDRIYEAVEPTPEQRAAIREAVIDYIREARLKPSDEQRQWLARTIYSALDEERRIKLLATALSAL